MKKILLLILLLSLNSCSSDGPFRKKDKLPAETQTGEDTAGCLVNGKVLIPHASGLFSQSALQCIYNIEEHVFILNFSDDSSSKSQREVVLNLNGQEILEGSTYKLNQKIERFFNFTETGAMYVVGSLSNSTSYYTNPIQTGELKITHLDTTKRIISGVFWFDGIDSQGGKVEIRAGRFDCIMR
jgi:hypothetical protein